MKSTKKKQTKKQIQLIVRRDYRALLIDRNDSKFKEISDRIENKNFKY